MRRVTSVCLALATLATGACNRESSPESARTAQRSRGVDPRPGAGVQPGISPQAVLGAMTNPHTGDPAAVMAGRQLFTGMNCAGCHSGYAGGGMGPSLRDSLWIYGNADVQIFSTIAEGRPYGMPAWAGRLNNDQIWQLVAYIRTLGTRDEPVKPPTPSQDDRALMAAAAR